jgi:DNA-directed RNA polymerase subunit RPC12/RpoP
MAEKKKKKDKQTKDESDDGIDLQSLISSLKAQSSDRSTSKENPVEETKPEPAEEKTEAAFELVDEEPQETKTEDKPSVLDSLAKLDDTKKSKGISEEEKKAFEEEKRQLQEAREKMEAERSSFEEAKSAFESERLALEEDRKGHHEAKNRTEDELRSVGTELLRKKDAMAKLDEQLKKKDAEQREKEKNIKKATDLLLSQRQTLADKEKKLESLREELTKKAEELKGKEEKVAALKDKMAELDARTIEVRELEEKLKERELRHKALEDEIASCPRCSSKDRFVSIESMISELKEFNITDEQAEKDLKEMRGLIDQNQNEKAVELAEKTMNRLKDLKDAVLAKGIMYLLASTDKSLRHAKEVGGHGEKVVDAERWLSQARELIQKEEYKTAEYYIKEAEFLLQTLTRGVAVTGPAPTEAASPPESVSRNYTCPSCQTTFTVDTIERPVRITCPGCQIELVIKEDVSFA